MEVVTGLAIARFQEAGRRLILASDYGARAGDQFERARLPDVDVTLGRVAPPEFAIDVAQLLLCDLRRTAAAQLVVEVVLGAAILRGQVREHHEPIDRDARQLLLVGTRVPVVLLVLHAPARPRDGDERTLDDER